MKARAKRGFSLLEMMVALAILVFIVIGIGIGMDAGIDIYKEAVFEADSASMAGIINTNLGDILRYSSRVTVNEGSNLKDPSGNIISKQDVDFIFTSKEYGIHDAYFTLVPPNEEADTGVLRITNLKKDKTMELVNTGAYPDLEIKDFKVVYYKPGLIVSGEPLRGGYFEATYKIVSTKDSAMIRESSTVIRLMNP